MFVLVFLVLVLGSWFLPILSNLSLLDQVRFGWPTFRSGQFSIFLDFL